MYVDLKNVRNQDRRDLTGTATTGRQRPGRFRAWNPLVGSRAESSAPEVAIGTGWWICDWQVPGTPYQEAAIRTAFASGKPLISQRGDERCKREPFCNGGLVATADQQVLITVSRPTTNHEVRLGSIGAGNDKKDRFLAVGPFVCCATS